MRIGVFGAGKVGSSLAIAWAVAGHQVVLSSRNLARAQHVAEGIGQAPSRSGGALWTGTPWEAASFGDMALLAVPSSQIGPLLRGCTGRGAALAVSRMLGGKVLIDATNPFAGWSIPRLAGRSHTECLAVLLPDVDVVKAFNMMPAVRMAEEAARLVAGRTATRAPLAVFMAGDAMQAKQVTEPLVRDAGFAAVDLGRLPAGAAFEPGTDLFAAELDEAAARSRLARLQDATAVLPPERVKAAA